jgi:hypothetical protein
VFVIAESRVDSPRIHLRRAREYLAQVKARIAAGTLFCSESFPDSAAVQRVPLPLSGRTVTSSTLSRSSDSAHRPRQQRGT